MNFPSASACRMGLKRPGCAVGNCFSCVRNPSIVCVGMAICDAYLLNVSRRMLNKVGGD